MEPIHKDIDPVIYYFLTELFQNEKLISEIWVIGSRVNGGINENSDWDFLLFVDSAQYDQIFINTLIPPEKLDLIVVLPNGEFVKPFGEIQGASLNIWNWALISDTKAKYMGQNNSIFDECSDGGDLFIEQLAFRIKSR